MRIQTIYLYVNLPFISKVTFLGDELETANGAAKPFSYHESKSQKRFGPTLLINTNVIMSDWITSP